MGNIQKRLLNRGYLLLEAVVTLMIVGVIVFTIVFQLNFFLSQEKLMTEKLLLHRRLNEEIAIQGRYGEGPLVYSRDGYSFSFQKREGLILRGVVEKEGEKLVIERTN